MRKLLIILLLSISIAANALTMGEFKAAPVEMRSDYLWNITLYLANEAGLVCITGADAIGQAEDAIYSAINISSGFIGNVLIDSIDAKDFISGTLILNYPCN